MFAKTTPLDFTRFSIANHSNFSSRAEFDHLEGNTVELVYEQSYLVTLLEWKTCFLLVT